MPKSQQFSLFDNAPQNEIDSPAEIEIDAPSDDKSLNQFSDYIVYVDESGDHGLESIDDNYPVFVLAFCIFHKRHYSEKIIPALEKFKFNHFGHDGVVLHENEMRRQVGDFTILQNQILRNQFMNELSSIIEASNFILVSCVIDKQRLKNNNPTPSNPYHIALAFCLKTLQEFLDEKKQSNRLTHVIVECRVLANV